MRAHRRPVSPTVAFRRACRSIRRLLTLVVALCRLAWLHFWLHRTRCTAVVECRLQPTPAIHGASSARVPMVASPCGVPARKADGCQADWASDDATQPRSARPLARRYRSESTTSPLVAVLSCHTSLAARPTALRRVRGRAGMSAEPTPPPVRALRCGQPAGRLNPPEIVRFALPRRCMTAAPRCR